MVLVLSDSQSSEMSKACTIISDKFGKELSEAINLNPEHSDLIHDAWKEDVAVIDAVKKDQSKNKTGLRGNRWSMVTYRLALAVKCRSTAAYKALKDLGVLQLPSLRSLNHFTSARIDKPGWCEEGIHYQQQRYQQHQERSEASGSLKPLGEGLIIFDEVKVVSKVLWNSKSEEIYGLAMTDEDMASLNDIFYELGSVDNTNRTEYVLQVIWRDLTSNFDVFGPYYTSSTSLDAKFTMACFLQSMQLLHSFGFKAIAAVFDGAATNLSMVKSMLGVHGAFAAEGNDHRINASIDHPYWRKHKLSFVVCPSHQLKNMINALYSSRQGGAKSFVTGDGVPFGWQSIFDLYDRERDRQNRGVPRDVPSLRKNYVHRDAWTKLNVYPAKLMQQELVITELKSHCAESPAPRNASSVQATVAYLQACNKVFEEGALSHQRICSSQSAPLLSMQEGYKFFSDWLIELKKSHPNQSFSRPSQTMFLAWQTWDLLRLMMFGFTELCADFNGRHPDYYIVPVRVTGSAVETVFAQLKQAAGGRLSAVNYSTARATLTLQRGLLPPHPSNKDYRDTALDLHDVPLLRK
eukprot:scpid67563/ scgid34906/ 